MGFIEEGRQLIQDFVTPEIRAIDARLTSLENRVDQMDARIEKRFDAAERRMDALDAKIDRNHAQLMNALQSTQVQNEILVRLARLESKVLNVA